MIWSVSRQYFSAVNFLTKSAIPCLNNRNVLVSGVECSMYSGFRFFSTKNTNEGTANLGVKDAEYTKTTSPFSSNLGFFVLFSSCGGLIGYMLNDIVNNKKNLKNKSDVWDFEWDRNSSPSHLQGIPNLGQLKPRTTRQLLLIRHGQYENVHSHNDEERGLTPTGKKQAELTGQRLGEFLKDKRVLAIHHSNMKRARETAQIIARHMPDVPIYEDPLLAEGVPAEPVPPSRSFKPSKRTIDRDSDRISRGFERYFYRAGSSYSDNHAISRNTQPQSVVSPSGVQAAVPQSVSPSSGVQAAVPQSVSPSSGVQAASPSGVQAASPSGVQAASPSGVQAAVQTNVREDVLVPNTLINVKADNKEESAKDDRQEFEILVCHGNVIRYFFLRILQLPVCAWLRMTCYHCGITWISIDNSGYVSARSFGDIGHIDAPIVTSR